MTFFVHSPMIHDIIYKKTTSNAVIGAGYSNAMYDIIGAKYTF